MRTWELTIDASADVPGAWYARLAAVIAQDIDRGRLVPGERLPSTRELAKRLGVNRNTVVAAFAQLHDSGRITGRTRSGTFVVGPSPALGALPDRPPCGFELPEGLPDDRPVPRTRGTLLLLGGVPELGFVPHRELARAYGRSLAGARGRRRLDYAEPEGSERLRVALGDWMARSRAVRVPPAQICVVRGSQHGLYLVARAVLRPGDRVAVEDPGFPPLRDVIRLVGAELVPIPVDSHGMDVAALIAADATQPVRAVAVTPHHQHPTTVTLAPDRRQALLAWAERRRVIVVEDDYDFDFHYDGPPVLPLAASDRAGVVVYVATLSKTLAPGLRLGWVAAPPPVIARIAAYRARVDQHGDPILEHALAELLEDGIVQRHVRRAHRQYRIRRDVLCEALHEQLPEVVFDVPTGGMALWARRPGTDATAWAAHGRAAGVVFQDGARFWVTPRESDHVRLGFSACDEGGLREAVLRMASAARAMRSCRVAGGDVL